MLAFEFYLNGIKLCTAGARELSILSADVFVTGSLGAHTKTSSLDFPTTVGMSVGGLTNFSKDNTRASVDWVPTQFIKVGDVVTVKIINSDISDIPTVRKEDDK